MPATQETLVQDVHNIIILNSVALYCMKRDLNRAKRILAQHLSTLNDGEIPAQATMLLVYIELRQGKIGYFSNFCLVQSYENRSHADLKNLYVFGVFLE